MRPSPLSIKVVIIILSSLCCGCYSLSAEQKQQKKLLLEAKKEHYQQLLASLRDQKITKGATAESIRQRFGEPDDIFSSGSNVSNLQIWTYEKITSVQEEETWDPIKLYFNNGILESSKF